jgi:hypothetical protein
MQRPSQGILERFSSSGNRLTASLPIFFLFIVTLYICLHCLFPVQGGDFFWTSALGHWGEWVFWSLFGWLLRRSSERAAIENKATPGNSRAELSSLFIPLVLLGAISSRKYNLLNWHIDLTKTSSMGIALAFAFGFYAEISQALFFKLVSDFVQRTVDRVIGRRLGKSIDDERYIQLYVDKRLHVAYRLAMSQSYGLPGHIASREQRIRYKVADFVGNAGFTVNALRSVYFGSAVLKISPLSLAELVAHEASHVYQSFLSDSVEQEIKAYVAGARVRDGLAPSHSRRSKKWLSLGKVLCHENGEFKDRNPEWQAAHQEAIKIVRAEAKLAPLYGIIPIDQKYLGNEDRKEMLRQAKFLLTDFLKTFRKTITKDKE